MRTRLSWLLLIVVTASGFGIAAGSNRFFPPLMTFRNPTGVAVTLVAAGEVSVDHPFFQSLGTNGRTCASCHAMEAAWTITPALVRARFDATAGLDPIFRLNDGSNAPTADVSTVEARRTAYSQLLGKGLIRIGLPIPPGAEFILTAVDDPYGYASAAELSLFRRPLPATNLAFLSTVMWDGRETVPEQSISADLATQANGATVGHAQGPPLSTSQRDQIVAFELGLFSAQARDVGAGPLRGGGHQELVTVPFHLGINSPQDPTGAPVLARAFTLYDGWAGATGVRGQARQSIVRGQAIMNQRVFTGGLTCTSCHNAPNVGSSSTGGLFDIGMSDGARRTPDLPLYTFSCFAGPRAGQVITSTDPGLALITGRCVDFGRFKVPTLRGLAARPPHFHNGSAGNLEAVVDFYNARFSIGLSPGERSDLVAFLRAL